MLSVSLLCLPVQVLFCFQGRMMAADFPAIASTSRREAEIREMKKVASHPKQAFPEFSLKS